MLTTAEGGNNKNNTQKMSTMPIMRSIALVVILAMSLVYFPLLWVNIAVLVDFYSPWALIDSKLFDTYHQFLVNRLPEKPEFPLPEISASQADYDLVYKLSRGFTFPIVIRQLFGNTSAFQNWNNHSWWVENYGSKELFCGTHTHIVNDCTVKVFFEALDQGNPFSVSGAAHLVDRHLELHEMIDNAAIREIEPVEEGSTQLFMGLSDMGTDIQTAVDGSM
jgi:hypothetical protein